MNGEFLRAFLRAYRASVAAVQADPRSFALKYAPVLGLPAPIVERGLTQTLFAVPSPAETASLYRSYLALVGDTKPLAEDFFFQE